MVIIFLLTRIYINELTLVIYIEVNVVISGALTYSNKNYMEGQSYSLTEPPFLPDIKLCDIGAHGGEKYINPLRKTLEY